MKDELRRINILLRVNGPIVGIWFLGTLSAMLIFVRGGYIVAMLSAFIFCTVMTGSLSEEASFLIPMTIKERNKRVLSYGFILSVVYAVLMAINKLVYTVIPVFVDRKKARGITSLMTKEDILLYAYMCLVVIGLVLSIKSVMGFSEEIYIGKVKLPKFVRFIFLFLSTMIYSLVATTFAMGENLKGSTTLLLVGMGCQLIDIFMEANQAREADLKWNANNKAK